MKIALSCFILFCQTTAFAYTSPTSYGDAQNQLQDLTMKALVVQKDLRKNIDEQAANYALLNQLNQAKIKAEEMRSRENITSAVKVADLGLNAAGILTGGAAFAAKEGGKQALKWYFAKKAAIEAAKEGAGVPSYSDAVKLGTYIFNKADERDIKASLNTESSEILSKAQKIFETEGTTIQQKILELSKLTTEMETKITEKDFYLKACVNRLETLKEDSEKLAKDTEKRRLEEEKRNTEMKKNVRDISYNPNISPKSASTPEINPPQSSAKETEEERKARIQKAIDEYIRSLSKKIQELEKKAGKEYYTINNPSGLRYSANDTVLEYMDAVSYAKKQAGEAENYGMAQSAEETARYGLENLKKMRSELNLRKDEIKNKVEPLIKDIAETIALWKMVETKYKPLGYYVSAAPELEKIPAYKDYYVNPISYAQTVLTATEGLDQEFSVAENTAKARKNLIFSHIEKFAENYSSKAVNFKETSKQKENRILSLMEIAAKETQNINDLPHYFALEFSYDGKKDLKNLRDIVQNAKSVYPKSAEKYRTASLLYNELIAQADELYKMASDPLYYEISYISASAKDNSHKQKMQSVLEKLKDFSPSLAIGYLEPSKTANELSNIVFSAADALIWLENAKTKIISAYKKAQTDFAAAAAKDFSSYYGNPQELREKLKSLEAPFLNADEEKSKVIEEARNMLFFDGKEPTLKRTGFWDMEIPKHIEALEKKRDDFWASDKGQKIRSTLNADEFQKIQDGRDANLSKVRALYDDLKKAYEAKNAALVMLLISPDWTSPEGEDAADLRQYLQNIFKVFNEMSFNISNLNMVKDSEGLYSVSYDLQITSKIYSKNIKRQEKSSVYEKVKIEANKALILKTQTGSYWQMN